MGLVAVLAVAALCRLQYNLGLWTASALGILVLGGLLGRRFQCGDAARFAGPALAMLSLAVALDVHWLSMGVDSPPEFWTGERGFRAVVEELKDPWYRGRPVMCRKDVGYYVPGRHVWAIDPHFSRGTGPLDVPWQARPLGPWLHAHWPYPVDDWGMHLSWERAFVDDQPGFVNALAAVDVVIDSDYDSFLSRAPLREAVQKDFVLSKHIGHYSVYDRRPESKSRRVLLPAGTL
jgi:hypothetical protein